MSHSTSAPSYRSIHSNYCVCTAAHAVTLCMLCMHPSSRMSRIDSRLPDLGSEIMVGLTMDVYDEHGQNFHRSRSGLGLYITKCSLATFCPTLSNPLILFCSIFFFCISVRLNLQSV